MVDPKNYHILSYDSLKSLIKNETISYSDLAALKDLFTNDIGSIRRSEGIRSLGELIDCLERRDVFSEYNIDALREIADNLDSRRLHAAVAQYIPPKVANGEPINCYQEERLSEEVRQISNYVDPRIAQKKSSSPSTKPAPVRELTEAQRAAVHKLLSREIGMQWRFFGRELEVGEGEMDAIELQYPSDLPSRIFKILKLFEEAKCCMKTEQAVRICNALDACGRKDLRRKVKQLICNGT